jgi:hypothetical protein
MIGERVAAHAIVAQQSFKNRRFLIHSQGEDQARDERERYRPTQHSQPPLAFPKRAQNDASNERPQRNPANNRSKSRGRHHSVRTSAIMKPRQKKNKFE